MCQRMFENLLPGVLLRNVTNILIHIPGRRAICQPQSIGLKQAKNALAMPPQLFLFPRPGSKCNKSHFSIHARTNAYPLLEGQKKL